MALVEAYPQLAAGGSAATAIWIARVADEVMDGRADTVDKTTRFRARVIGAAVMGMVDAVMREWYREGPDANFVSLYDEGFSLIVPLFAP
jgi:hypothetical protein